MDDDELQRWTRVGYERGMRHVRASVNQPKVASVRVVNREEQVTSVRQAAAVCNVTPRVVRRWLSFGLIPGPPWTPQQLHNARDMTDPQGRRRRGPQVAHGTMTHWE